MVRPEDYLRRTPLQTVLASHGVAWTSIGDAAVADGQGDAAAVDNLAIADLSPLPRVGFKGRDTIEAMQRRGLHVERAPNRAYRQPDGSLCLVLGPGEVMVLGPLSGQAAGIDGLMSSWRLEDQERTYPLLRRDSHAWFAITGRKAPEMFAKICAIDLRLDKFRDLSIAQTSVAKLTAIINRADIGAVPVFHLLADSASALYLFDCLLDAFAEFGGRIVGLNAMREIGN